jgi:DNA mismatch endonuclease (patch repair protein)
MKGEPKTTQRVIMSGLPAEAPSLTSAPGDGYRLDPLSPAERSERMGRVKNADTKPEMAVRRLIYAMGYRYRLHAPDLPGRPDIVFRGRRKVIFVHGCFWHQHGCAQYRMPKTNTAFWLPKLEKNKARDRKVHQDIRKLGWKALVIWECQVKRASRLKQRIKRFLEAGQ